MTRLLNSHLVQLERCKLGITLDMINDCIDGRKGFNNPRRGPGKLDLESQNHRECSLQYPWSILLDMSGLYKEWSVRIQMREMIFQIEEEYSVIALDVHKFLSLFREIERVEGREEKN